MLAAIISAGCRAGEPFAGLFRQQESPYEEYLAQLTESGLDRSALGRDWIAAGRRALDRPVAARLPFRETGYFPPHDPAAVVYQLELRRGRTLVIEVTLDSAEPARIFVDLFQRADTNPPRRVVSLAAGDSTLRYEVRRDGTYLLRLQPELLRGGRWTVVERTQASLGFPVPGLGVRAVRSRFGADRDAGRRRHQGIDIFAPRGTPVVAVVEGVARISTNELGGNVVWLYDPVRARTYYYAHLDRWAAGADARVMPGDTLGFVGTTGNARTTPPHLHFGIYEGGPVDPLPFLLPDDPAPPAATLPSAGLDGWVRVTALETALRGGADRGADTMGRLERGTLARVTGVAQRAFRVALPDGRMGYLDAGAVRAAEPAARRAELGEGVAMLEAPVGDAPVVEVLGRAATVDVLGRFAGYQLIRMGDGNMGWIADQLLSPLDSVVHFPHTAGKHS